MNTNESVCIKSFGSLVDWLNTNKIELILPDLQRNYVWDLMQWMDMWEDILLVYQKVSGKNKLGQQNAQEEPQHFMGTLILSKVGDNTNPTQYYIIDGQQRYTTLSVLIDYLKDVLNENNQTWKNSNLSTREDDFNPEEDKKKENTYQEVYDFYAEAFSLAGFKTNDAQGLLNVINNRLFWMVKIIDEKEKNKQFENINATGKQLEYADLLLNYLFEINTNKNTDIKTKWNNILNNIYQSNIPVSNDEVSEEDEQNEYNDIIRPLKLKKFLNALHSITLSSARNIRESVDSFEKIFLRLNEEKPIKAEYVLEQMEYWSTLYIAIINPLSINEKNNPLMCLKPDLYYLGIIVSSKMIPMCMRVLDKYEKNKYSQEDVQSIFGAIVRFKLFAAIHYDRGNTDIRKSEEKIMVLDYILDFFSLPGKLNMWTVLDVIMYKNGRTLLDEYKNWCGENGLIEGDIKKYQYNSNISKLLLVIEYDKKNDKNKKIYELEDKSNCFQVEHVLAQNINESIDKYGFDVNALGQIENLILLERTINNQINNNKPEDKDKDLGWKVSKLYKFYEHYISIQSKVQYHEKLCGRLKSICTAVCGYLSEVCKKELSNVNENSGEENLLPYFMEIKYCAGSEYCAYSSISQEENENCRHYSWNKGDIKIVPEIKRDTVKLLKIHSPEGDNLDESNETTNVTLLSRFVDLSGENNLYEWLANKEGILEEKDLKGLGYLAKMIHTLPNPCDEDRANDYYRNLSSIARSENKTAANAKYRSIEDLEAAKGYAALLFPKPSEIIGENDKCIQICGDYNSKDVINNLKKIYKLCTDEPQSWCEFGLWVEVSVSQIYFINGIRYRLPYINIGDREKFETWLSEKKKLQIDNDTNIARNVTVQKDDLDSSHIYFNAETKFFKEYKSQTMNIPEYQRRYVWDKSNWKSLIESIRKQKIINLGTIIVYNNNSLTIVDGQQRLTTLAILESVINNQNLESSQLYTCLYDEKNNQKNIAKTYFETYFKHNESDLKEFSVDEVQFDVLTIGENAPTAYQYDVFSSVNGKGKKLTFEEKIKNYLHMIVKEDKNKEYIDDITNTKGFIKAYLEMVNKEHIADSEAYDEFKKMVSDYKMFENMHSYIYAYQYMKGESNKKPKPFSLIKENNKELYFYIRMYRMLDISTADAYLLDVLHEWSKLPNKTDVLCEKYKRVMMIYFLLYTMDRSGNDKKSINSKFPKLCGMDIKVKRENEEKIILVSENFPDKEKVFEYIWGQFVTTYAIGEVGHQAVGRFILAMIEKWLGNTVILNEGGKIKIEQCEIEHICPVSEDNYPKNFKAPIYKNRLQNICLLEANINRSVGNTMLQKLNNEKIGKCARKPSKRKYTYGNSEMKIPNRIFNNLTQKSESSFGKESEPNFGKEFDDKIVAFDEECSQKLLDEIKKSVEKSMMEDLNSVL